MMLTLATQSWMDIDYGIFIVDSTKNFLKGNIISGSQMYGIVIYGIRRSDSLFNTLRENKLLGNNYNLGVYGITLSDFIQEIDISNTVDGKPVYYWINHSDRQIPVDAGYVALINSTNIVVSNLALKNSQGVLIAYTQNSIIENVSVSESIRGIFLIHSKNNIIRRNYLLKNSEGIRLTFSSNNVIAENKILSSHSIGIMMENSFNNSIFRNILMINFDAIDLFRSNNNKFFHNNFVNNTYQVHHVTFSSNIWDDGYPSGGNYWSDYKGFDYYSGPFQNETGNDGIGDTPYVIDYYNRDRYPLMNPWGFRDIAVFDVSPSANVTYAGRVITINVSISNLGNLVEIFNVYLYFDNNLMDARLVENLTPGTDATITFYWNTTGIKPCSYYNLTAMVDVLPGEVDTTNNILLDGSVRIKMVGDLNDDDKVDIKDLVQAGLAYGSYPGHLRWDPNADLNIDDKIDMYDMILIAKNFGEECA